MPSERRHDPQQPHSHRQSHAANTSHKKQTSSSVRIKKGEGAPVRSTQAKSATQRRPAKSAVQESQAKPPTQKSQAKSATQKTQAKPASQKSQTKSAAQAQQRASQNKKPAQPSASKGALQKLKAIPLPARIGAGLGLLVLLAYVAGAVYFMGHFWPQTTLCNTDISLSNARDAREKLDKAISNYQVNVRGNGMNFVLTSDDIAISFDGDKSLNEIIAKHNPWTWPVQFFVSHDVNESFVSSAKAEDIAQKIEAKVKEFNDAQTPSEDAGISYNNLEHRFVIRPEIIGYQVDAHLLSEKVLHGITHLDKTIGVTEQEMIRPKLLSNDPRLEQALEQANKLLGLTLHFTLNGNEIRLLSADDIAPQISLDDQLKVQLNPSFVEQCVNTFASDYNTKGSQRTYTRPDGKTITVSGGTYGWVLDKEALEQKICECIANPSDVHIELPFAQTAQVITKPGNPDWGSYVDVDLSEQRARLYNAAGALVWEAEIVTGRPDPKHATPTGVYSVNAKKSPSVLIGENLPGTNKPEYKTEVKFWMPFIGNAIGFHDAPWQSSFGGTRFRDGFGSHGCVNLSPSDAANLYNVLSQGEVVVVHN